MPGVPTGSHLRAAGIGGSITPGNNNMGRYQQSHTSKWRDKKYRALSDPGKLLFDYYQSSPNSNSLGVYQLSDKWAIKDIDWDTKAGRKKFKGAKLELIGSNMVQFDPKMDLVTVVNHLKYNPLRNPNAVKNAQRCLEILPESPIYQHLNIEPLRESFHEPLRQQLRYSVAVTLLKPLPELSGDISDDQHKKNLEKFDLPDPDRPEAEEAPPPKPKAKDKKTKTKKKNKKSPF